MRRPSSPVKNLAVAAGLAALLLTQAACRVNVTVTGDGNADASSQASAEQQAEPEALTMTTSVSQDKKYDAVVFSLTQDEFEACGYSLGDSVNVKFSNGSSIDDVPFFNGYYVRLGAPVVVAYPGQEFVSFTFNNMGAWTQEGISDSDTAEITMNERGKYLATQQALGQDYPTTRESYASDEQFANFRALSGGKLKKDFLYRGASPVDNARGRAAYVDDLLEATGITCVVDLADSTEEMEGYFAATGFDSPYVQGLYEQGRVATLSMSSSFTSDSYKQKLGVGMKHLLSCGGPAYIHCLEGKDRTGFVCMLVEALAGASYDEMCSDYMQTYANYYGITKDGTPDRYDAVVSLYFDAFIEFLHGAEDGQIDKTANYSEDAKAYLRECGLTDAEIEQLVALICE